MNKFDEKDYYVDSLDECSLFAINLIYSYEHTNLITFKEKYTEIMDKLLSLYDEDNNIIQKLTDKKDIKYTSFDICFYLIAFILFSNKSGNSREYNQRISNIYKKYILNSNIITSWPDAPDLDNAERYKKSSMLSKDMLDETFFRMPNLPTLNSTGMCPIFLKNITYSKKKDTFETSRKSFDSYKNMFIYFTFIHVFKDMFIDSLDFNEDKKLLTRNSTSNHSNTKTKNSIDDSKSDDDEEIVSNENEDAKNSVDDTNNRDDENNIKED